MPVVCVKMPEALLERVDSLWPRLGFESRGEFIRAAIQFYIAYISFRGGDDNAARRLQVR